MASDSKQRLAVDADEDETPTGCRRAATAQLTAYGQAGAIATIPELFHAGFVLGDAFLRHDEAHGRLAFGRQDLHTEHLRPPFDRRSDTIPVEPWAGGSGTVTTEPWLVPALVVPTMLTATNGESDDQNEPYRETDLSVAVTTS